MLKTNDIKIIIKICKPSYSDLRTHERTVFLIIETSGNYAVVPQRGPIVLCDTHSWDAPLWVSEEKYKAKH